MTIGGGHGCGTGGKGQGIGAGGAGGHCEQDAHLGYSNPYCPKQAHTRQSVVVLT